MLNISDTIKLTHDENIDNHTQYVNPGLVKMLRMINVDKRLVKAKDCLVQDSDGHEYLDFLGGFGALSLGHNNDILIEEMRKVQEFPNILQISLNPFAGALAKNLAEISPGDLQISFFANSGAEAVEGAIKIARKYSGKTKIVSCFGGYHGKTYGALSVSGREDYKEPFQPLLPDIEFVEFGNADQLEQALIKHDVAAFITEPIQGENGIIVPPSGYLKKVRDLCTKSHTLLILDEIQTGLGKTGYLFACNAEDVTPDIMCLSKAISGGIMPLSVFITTAKIWKKAYGKMDDCTLHTSTFSENTWSMAAGIVALDLLVNGSLIGEAAEKGAYMLKKLRRLVADSPIIKEVRGKGLMIGIEFDDSNHRLMRKMSSEYLGSLIAGELLNKYHIITAYTMHNPNVIRLEPPLTITYGQLDKFYDAIMEISHNYKSFAGIAKSTLSSKIKSND